MEIGLSLSEETTTAAFRLDNKSSEPLVTTPICTNYNRLVIVAPDGKQTEWFAWKDGIPPVVVEPGASHVWSLDLAASREFREPGTYRVTWKVGEVESQSAIVIRAELSGAARIRSDAKWMQTFDRGGLANSFLNVASDLPLIKTRTLFRDETTREWFSEARAMAIPEEARAKLQKKELDEEFYYNTNYGTPLAYVRPLELLDKSGFSDANHTRILDFGYGGVGQLRMLATLGADVVGVEVGTLQPALYCEPSDQGIIQGHFGRKGQLTLVNGRFSEEAVVKAVGDGYDLFLSKNTLKNGYLHPEKPVDKRMLVDLGVDEETFARTVFRILKPSGRFMIYNICPAPAPPDKPYIPWADGRSPFSKSLLESTGFKVVAFDVDDTPAVRLMAKALGWDRGEDAMDLEKDLFATYTLVAKP